MRISLVNWRVARAAFTCMSICVLAASCGTPRVADRTPRSGKYNTPGPAAFEADSPPSENCVVAANGASSRRVPSGLDLGHPPRPNGIRAELALHRSTTSGLSESAAPIVRLQDDRRPFPQARLDDLFPDSQELELPQLVDAVLSRNRTLAAMRAASLSAAQRYPQARALDDPVFTSALAPASLTSNVAPGNSAGYMIGGAQKLPWFGKRSLRGDAALAESRAAQWDAADVRLQVIEAASLAYYDYFLVRQDLALNRENSAKLREFHDIAARKYEVNQAPQQDMLQAKVELAELAQRQLELERLERIAIARINTLMHRPPDAYLPPAPLRLDSPRLTMSAANLRTAALGRRPDLAAAGARLRAEQAQLQLAYKEFLPDFEVYGRYDNFWSQASLRGQMGLNMNVPLYRDKRHAAAREAQWRVAQRRAEYEQLMDDVNREVQIAFEQFDEAQQTLGLYVEQILPAARQNVDSAQAAYEASGGDFLRLVAAQRQLIVLQERYQESIANYHRRRSELERVVGQSLPSAPSEAIPAVR